MLTTLAEERFSDRSWSFERKLDGERCLGFRRGSRRTGVPVFYYLFDLLYLDGADLTRLELRHSKGTAWRAVSFGGRLRLSIHRVGSGEAYHREACRRGWEGVVAKRAAVAGPDRLAHLSFSQSVERRRWGCIG